MTNRSDRTTTSVRTLESPTESATLDQLVDSSGTTAISFATTETQFLLYSQLTRDTPCPRCIFLHFASSESEVERIRYGNVTNTEPPSKSGIRFACQYGLGDETAPALFAIDQDGDVTIKTEAVCKHPVCSHDRFPRGTDIQPVEGLSPLHRRFVDSQVGIVRDVNLRSVGEIVPGDVLDSYYTSGTIAINPMFWVAPRRYDRFVEAGGAGKTPEEALLPGIVEGLERYTTMQPHIEDLRCSAEAVPGQVIQPDQFYTAETDPLGDRATGWVETRSLTADEMVFVPSDLVSVVSPADRPRCVRCSSNGMAAHTDADAAIVGGVEELFERDAILRAWYACDAEKPIDPRTLPMDAADSVRALETLGYDVSVLNLTRVEPFYTLLILGFAPDTNTVPTTLLGAGCAFDTATALEDALEEAVDLLAAACSRGWPRVEEPTDVVTTTDHFGFYQVENRYRHLESLVADGTRAFCCRRTERSLGTTVSALEQAGIRVFVRDCTTPTLARYGVTTVKTLSPDLLPVTFGYDNERLHHPTDPVSDRRPSDLPHPIP